jgi:ketosteroid isomerase-like protein
MDKAIEKLFSEYEKAFNALDIHKNAELYTDTFISAGPRGAIAHSKEEFLRLAEQAVEFYQKAGRVSAQILSMEESPISNEYSLVKTHWAARFKKNGDKTMEFDVSFIVQKSRPDPRIIMLIAHQDEQKAMEELGLKPEQPA